MLMYLAEEEKTKTKTKWLKDPVFTTYIFGEKGGGGFQEYKISHSESEFWTSQFFIGQPDQTKPNTKKRKILQT